MIRQDTVYALAGAGDTLYAARASGLYRSRDGGATWINTFAPLEQGPLAAVSVAAHGQSVFAGVNGAVLRSHDRGETWQIAGLAAPPPLVTALALSPDFDGTIFAGTAEDGVFISTDRGETWVAWNFGLLDLHVYALAVSPDFGRDRTVYVGTETGVFVSRNGGRGWRETAFPMDAAPVLSLGLTDLLLAGTEARGLYISEDGGASWGQVDLPSGAIHAIQREPHLAVLLENGLARSDDGGRSWALAASFQQTALAMLADLPHAFLVGFDDGEIARITL